MAVPFMPDLREGLEDHTISKRMQSMLQPIRIPISILSANGVKNETAILTIVEYCSRLKPMVSISSTGETVT